MTPVASPGEEPEMNHREHRGHRAEPAAVDGLSELMRAVIGAAIEVHKVLGPGFLESIYEEALGVELGLRGISYRRQAPIGLEYKSAEIGKVRIDLLIEEQLIVELKAVSALAEIHRAQLISYLKASGLRLGLLVNFNVRVLTEGVCRVVYG